MRRGRQVSVPEPSRAASAAGACAAGRRRQFRRTARSSRDPTPHSHSRPGGRADIAGTLNPLRPEPVHPRRSVRSARRPAYAPAGRFFRKAPSRRRSLAFPLRAWVPLRSSRSRPSPLLDRARSNLCWREPRSSSSRRPFRPPTCIPAREPEPRGQRRRGRRIG